MDRLVMVICPVYWPTECFSIAPGEHRRRQWPVRGGKRWRVSGFLRELPRPPECLTHQTASGREDQPVFVISVDKSATSGDPIIETCLGNEQGRPPGARSNGRLDPPCDHWRTRGQEYRTYLSLYLSLAALVAVRDIMDTMTKRIRRFTSWSCRLGDLLVILSRGYRVSVPVAAPILLRAAASHGLAERSGNRPLRGGTAPWPVMPGNGPAGHWY